MKLILKVQVLFMAVKPWVIKVQELLLQHLQLFTCPHEEATETKQKV